MPTPSPRPLVALLLAATCAAALPVPPLGAAGLKNATLLPRKPANVSEAKALLAEAATILNDDLAAWKPLLDHAAAGFTIAPAPNVSSPLCSGPTCARVSAMLPLLAFKAKKAMVRCSESDFMLGACFAPGCAVCDPSCPIFKEAPFLLQSPGPLGTGLFCNGCSPCCEKADAPNRRLNSTCLVV